MPFYIAEDKCRLYYETLGFKGNKSTILLLNGTAQTTYNWKSHARAFSDDYQVIMYDARAQGQSSMGDRRLTLKLHVSDLYGLLKHLDIQKTSLVGISHGARVAVSFAAEYPDLIKKMILCSMTAALSGKTKQMIKTWKEILTKEGVEIMMNEFLPKVLGKDYQLQNQVIFKKMVQVLVKRNRKEALMAHMIAMSEYEPIARAATNVSSPTLVLSGTEDCLIDMQGAKKLAQLCHGEHKSLNGVGHTIPAEAPKRFQQEVIRFLSDD